MARRTSFREQNYTGTRRYKCAREECRHYQGETICTLVMVVCSYLWINVFVWADFFCGIRYYQFASLDCSGVIRIIHMRKIRRGQGQSLIEIWQISCLEDIRQAQIDFSGLRGPRWRAMWYYTWLEELVSESNIIQTQEDISVSGKIAGNTKPKFCIYLVWFIGNISGLVSSFGLSSCVAQHIISLLHWIAAGSSRKSIWESLRWDKVSPLDRILTYFMLRGR